MKSKNGLFMKKQYKKKKPYHINKIEWLLYIQFFFYSAIAPNYIKKKKKIG